jgi:hypothetical protein
MKIDIEDLKPLIEAVTSEVLRQQEREAEDGRLGYTEAEAASTLGIAPHVLRDARLRQEIAARRVGKRYVYSRDSLRQFLLATK